MHYLASAGKQTTPCICQKKKRLREGDGKYKKILILDYILVQTTEEKKILLLLEDFYQHAQSQLAFLNKNSKAGFYTLTPTLGFINGLQWPATVCTVSIHNRSYSALLEGPINDVHKQ